MTIKNKITTGIAGVALFAAVLTPAAFADTNIEIVNNGADSNNQVSVETANVTDLTQRNKTDVVNVISVNSNTGGNTANKNTGGDVTVDTGDADTTVTTTVAGGTNTANVNNCCGCESNNTISIRRNGTGSTNKVIVTKANVSVSKQKNKTNVTNVISTKSKTGKNKANKNTGGTVDLTTGNATTTVDTTVTGSTNELNQTGCCEPSVLE